MTWVLTNTVHGPMIVNTNDWAETATGMRYGVSHQLLTNGSYDPEEVAYSKELLTLLRRYHGDNIVAIDGGANLGVFTLEWARHMAGWGTVWAIEPQERVHYALAGNVALNNITNAHSIMKVITDGTVRTLFPEPNYDIPCSIGSIGQVEHHDCGQDFTLWNAVDGDSIDVMFGNYGAVHLIKLDLEGGEMGALKGAEHTVMEYRPALIVEYLKSDRTELMRWMEEHGYGVRVMPRNLVCVERTSLLWDHVGHWGVR